MGIGLCACHFTCCAPASVTDVALSFNSVKHPATVLFAAGSGITPIFICNGIYPKLEPVNSLPELTNNVIVPNSLNNN